MTTDNIERDEDECRAAEDKKIERAQIEQVFGLCGGELRNSGDNGGDANWNFGYWYDGPPDYLGFSERDSLEWIPTADGMGTEWHEIRTAIVCEIYGNVNTPDGWERVLEFSSCGETECGCRYNSDQGTDDNEPDPDCALCDGSGFIYIGDGYREVVFRAIASS